MSQITHVLAPAVDPVEIHPGAQVRTLWQGASGAQALLVDLAPGARYSRLKVLGGPEVVYVISGVFNDGSRDYPAGSFLHYPAGASQVPQSRQGCRLFVFLPEG